MADAKGPEPEGDDDVRSTLATLVDLLARSVTLPSERIRETLDDAVRRGRMTRDDADDLVERLVASGRAQSEELLGRLERLPGVGDRARAAVQRVERVRRAAVLRGAEAFPIADYDDLTAAQVMARLAALQEPELRAVREHEKRNANRKSVLGAIEHRLRAA
jgi:polyhydroxyalkanoate synthesis regulator phasin